MYHLKYNNLPSNKRSSVTIFCNLSSISFRSPWIFCKLLCCECLSGLCKDDGVLSLWILMRESDIGNDSFSILVIAFIEYFSSLQFELLELNHWEKPLSDGFISDLFVPKI